MQACISVRVCVCACVRVCVRACVRAGVLVCASACVRECVRACVRQLNGNVIAFRNLENMTSCIVLNLSKKDNQISGAVRKERVSVHIH